MKGKTTPYILLSLFAVALIAMFITGQGKKKKLDERITFRKKDKIPYGTWVAFQSLPEFFPGAAVYTTRQEPGYWDSVSIYDSRQAFIAITPKFMPDEYEMGKLISFAENGNDVFISAKYISADVEEMLNCSVYDGYGAYLFDDGTKVLGASEDTLEVRLLKPPFPVAAKYKYPGKKHDASFTRIDNSTTNELGITETGITNFIHLRAGEGNFYLHLAPMALTNYFLLHKDNMEYYEKVMSVISPDVEKIIWDEYFLMKRDGPRQQKKSWIKVLFGYPALKAALLTAMGALLLYVLLGMRRRQRYIPVLAKPRNDSLDFVKTIGRLYYDKSDHKNLCRKMGSYFLEHVRSKYKLLTGNLDENFIRNLQFKTGAEESEIRGIVSFIKYAEDAPAISPAEVTEFHKQLESFYKKA
ncbi:MAG: DUF4350 domain-containing protein [Bacteroidota bacterium]